MTENEKLARAAIGGVLKMMAIKWAVIIVLTKLARRAAEKAS